MERTAKKKQLRLKTNKKDKEVTIEKSYLAIYNFAQFGGWYAYYQIFQKVDRAPKCGAQCLERFFVSFSAS
jgi:hypothetical protein